MAKVRGPLNSLQASGSVGSVTYGRTRHGQFARAYTVPLQPNSADQLAWRAVMTNLSAEWSDPAIITPALMQRWIQFSQTYTNQNHWGEAKRLDPMRWYLKINWFRKYKALASITTPPINPGANYIPNIVFFWDTDGIFCEVFPRPTGDQFVLISKVAAKPITTNRPGNETTFGAFYDSASTGPVQIWAAIDIDTNPHNWFFRSTCVDEQGRSSSHQWDKVFTTGTPPDTTIVKTNSNLIKSDTATTTFLNSTALNVLKSAGTTDKTLLEFDFSALTYTSVSKSFLYLLVFSGGPYSGVMQINGTITTYTPAQVTWNNSATGVPWSSPGGISGVDYEARIQDTLSGSVESGVWVRFDITNWANAVLPSASTQNQLWCQTDDLGSEFIFEYTPASSAPFILNVPNIT